MRVLRIAIVCLTSCKSLQSLQCKVILLPFYDCPPISEWLFNMKARPNRSNGLNLKRYCQRVYSLRLSVSSYRLGYPPGTPSHLADTDISHFTKGKHIEIEFLSGAKIYKFITLLKENILNYSEFEIQIFRKLRVPCQFKQLKDFESKRETRDRSDSIFLNSRNPPVSVCRLMNSKSFLRLRLSI